MQVPSEHSPSFKLHLGIPGIELNPSQLFLFENDYLAQLVYDRIYRMQEKSPKDYRVMRRPIVQMENSVETMDLYRIEIVFRITPVLRYGLMHSNECRDGP